MASPIWEPLERFAREFVHSGKLRPVLEVRDGVIQRISLSLGEGVERVWTLEEVRKAKALVE